MKRILFVMVLCLALSMLFANGSAENAKAETIKIVLADINNAESIPGKTSQALADMINAESNGRIVVETYLGGQLGNEADTISNLRSGVVGITKINVANLETRGIAVPEYTLFGLPYLFRSKQHAEKYFYSEKGAELAAKIGEATNGEIYGLNGYLIAAPRSFFFKSEVHSMAEAAGKKVRSESTPMKIDMMTAFGMSATPLGLNDMYSGLQTGMIDGGEHNVSTIKSYAFYEQCPYVLLTRNNYNANIFLISGVLKDQLSDEDLALINECVKKVSIEYSKLFEEDDAKTMAELEAKGVKFIEPTDPEAWQNAALSLYEKYAVGYDDFISEVLSYDN